MTNNPRWAVAAGVGIVVLLSGCVRRTLTIQTEPSGALVTLNDRELGRSNLTVDFIWYGDYDVVIRKEGYKTLKTNWVVRTPWYQHAPFDFFAEVLWPGRITDEHSLSLELEPETLPVPQEVQARALQMRSEALGLKPGDAPPQP